MDLPTIKTLSRWTALAAFGLSAAAAQTQDTSGNGLLKGTFHFRDVAVQNVDANYNPTEITASSGTITFNGAGNYTISGTTVDNTVSGGAPQALSVTGTYAIGANGTGLLVNFIYPNDPDAYIYGAVSQGVFTGSATESEGDGNIFNDLFVAIPAPPQAPTNASFTAPYQTGLVDFANAGSAAIKNALFQLAPNGQGAFGTIALNGQASNINSATVSQSVTGATYGFNSDGSATLTIPLPSGANSTTALFAGSKTMFQSADGNFILGWTATGYDIFFGVKALTVTGSNTLSGGLYFTAAVEDSPSAAGTDSYYGSTKLFGNSNGDGIVHQRLNLPDTSSFDYGTDTAVNLNSDGSTDVDLNGYEYLFGDGAQAFVAIGTSGNYSLLVGTRTPNFTGPGVYLDPVGVVNAASDQPITASLSPGEFITLYGTGLAAANATATGSTYPTSLGNVSVTIDGIACPLQFVSGTQINLLVPYEVATNQTGLANIQVTNNNVQSNIVQMYLTDGSPGAFSLNETGIGLASAVHATGPNAGQLITTANPVQPGEYISLFLSGLGTVTPAVTDGYAGSSTNLSYSDIYNAGNLSVYFNDYDAGSTGNVGTIQYAGLAPFLVGLYQINVQVPSGLTAGDDVYIEFVTDAADVNQIQIPYGAGAATPTAATTAEARKRGSAARTQTIKSHRSRPKSQKLRKAGLVSAIH